MRRKAERRIGRQPKPRKRQTAAQMPTDDQKESQPPSKQFSKIDVMVSILSRPEGANLAQLAEATGWQKHSIRGAMAGTLKKKGFSIRSEPAEGGRRYRIGGTG